MKGTGLGLAITKRLVELNSASDAIQITSDNLKDTRHFANTLFNIMRGGIFDDNYQIEKWDFKNYLEQANTKVAFTSEEIIEKDLSFNCDDCEFTSKEEQDLWRHTEKVHFQCAECDLKLNSESSLKLHRKEKHCDSCGKVVTSYWHHKYLPRGDIYDVCGQDCYVDFFNEIVNPPPPPGLIYG